MTQGTPPNRVDPEWVKAAYNELIGMQVELDDDPLAFGPKRLNSKIAQVRKFLSRTEQIFLESSRLRHLIQRDLTAVRAKFSLQKDHLFVHDPDTKAGRNVADREAIAKSKLRPVVDEMFQLEVAINDLDSLLTVVRAKRTDLKDIQGRIRDQLTICQQELGLGARWGSKADSKNAISPSSVSTVEYDSIDKLIEEVAQEVPLPERVGDVPADSNGHASKGMLGIDPKALDGGSSLGDSGVTGPTNECLSVPAALVGFGSEQDMDALLDRISMDPLVVKEPILISDEDLDKILG